MPNSTLIKTAALQLGMRLAKEVYDPYGQLLMRAGTVLGERQIKALRTWGIEEVSVAVDPSPGSALEHPEAVAAVCRLIDDRFSLSNLDHPAVQTLYALCLNRALERL